MPEATYSRKTSSSVFPEKGAAYVFHLVKNHPFVDGNKRIGLATGLVFLSLNDVPIEATDDELVTLIVGVRGRPREARPTCRYSCATTRGGSRASQLARHRSRRVYVPRRIFVARDAVADLQDR